MLTSLVLAAALLPADAPARSGLPADWHGRWTGTLKITPVAGDPQETPMEMVIEPLKDSKNYRWRIVYGKGPARDYELIPQEKAGHFVIDEKNGLLIDAWLVGSTVYSQFQVEDSLIPVRYERTGDTLRFSLTVSSTRDPRTTKMEKGKFEAKAFRLESVHVAELKKAKGD
jgi:hypothetical protein